MKRHLVILVGQCGKREKFKSIQSTYTSDVNESWATRIILLINFTIIVIIIIDTHRSPLLL